ncbi:MAG: ATP-dependent Clp protease ATP-binding subunit [Acidobacteria bacterium]|jgi:ATP-dependent Clp protease ATP-binding subunit ClpC|nr:ATP-dependent Clp protease ATP-binding subunit [Acidobacteriota bacterium]
MNIQFNQFKKLSTFLETFSQQLEIEKNELNKTDAEKLIRSLVFIIDGLIKAENLCKKRNLILPNGRSYFSSDTMEVMTNINLYLYKFETRVLNFTRTERQTFIFILENVIDYFKNSAAYANQKDKRNVFLDYRFWIENFFKIIDQKLSGVLSTNNPVNSKRFFNTAESLKDQLIFTAGELSFNIFPFIINVENQYLFLAGITEHGLLYKDLGCENDFFIENEEYEQLVFEFLFANFDFAQAEKLKERLRGSENGVFIDSLPAVRKAYEYHRERRFKESSDLLKEISFDRLNLPLVYLLQIKNLVNINRVFDVKQLMQKFVLLYPYYVDAYEILGDIYLKEENFELALNFYEKVLMLTQNKRVAEKLKGVKEAFLRNKGKPVQQHNEYFYDITEAAFQSEEEIILREKEQRQMIEILLSNSRRNVLLVGDNGVGKTALVKLLSRNILEGNIPPFLKEKRLKEINFVSLLTGSKYRGQFEEKALRLLQEFKNQNAILVMEDMHLMMASAGARGTSLDLVNILKQFLRENTIQVIATTNYEEYKNTIEKDNALLGFFQKIMVNELSIEDTKMVLNNLAKNVFARDKIQVSGDVLDLIIESAKRDIREKKLPDSAVMIFERVIAKVKIKAYNEELPGFYVEPSDVAEVLSDMLNLPVTNIAISLNERLAGLKEALLRQIVGQDNCVGRVVANIITSKLNFDIKKNRPDGVFLFIGPTGVGKTETAIALAKALYGSTDYLIRIDMSEYMERFTYSRFVGAAPGYVGYMDSNQLTDKVRQNPYSIILLDEIEKADSQLLNIFLQVFDAGRLTDARGNIVDFSHTTIIMTSNIGTSLFSRVQLGYRSELDGAMVSHASLLKALKKYFSPEFLNRIDEVVIFEHLKENDIKKIIAIHLAGVFEQFEKMDKELIIKDEVIDFIISNGYSKEYGARHIARALRQYIMEKLAQCSLEKDWDDARQVICSLDNGEVKVALANISNLADLEPSVMEALAGQEF